MPEDFGKYRLLRKLGVGGVAEVWLACQDRGPDGPKLLVVKRCLRHLDAEDALAGMFSHEARVASRLHHPHIAQVLDVGRFDDRYFLARELVAGPSLRALMTRAAADPGGLGLGAAATIVVQLCEALEHAHRATDDTGHELGIVHADVNPDNVVVGYDGTLKLIDFGVARARFVDAPPAAGTYAYMPPEQARGEPLGPAADVFSVGVILWELVSGRSLFGRSANHLTLRAAVVDDVPPVAHSGLAPQAARELDDLLAGTLAKDPARRCQSCKDLAAAVVEMSRRHDWHASGATLEDALTRLCGPERARIAAALGDTDAQSIEDLLLARLGVDAIGEIDWLVPQE